MKQAKLIIKRLDSKNLRYTLRGGVKGTGKVLFTCRSWDNPRATDQAEKWVADFIKRNNLQVVQA